MNYKYQIYFGIIFYFLDVFLDPFRETYSSMISNNALFATS